MVESKIQLNYDKRIAFKNIINVRTFQCKYWNEDENFLVVVPNVNINIVDEFIDILEFYMLSKVQANTVLKEESLNVLR